ncbi:MAG: hypothetical protein EHM24_25870 [Acidobacteria bacterium]|nr:MAG: hypothetical protein EHM24_25870 [Acidobacteriota bacterium]
MPASLGLRPQAVKLRFAASPLATRFLPVCAPPPLPDDHLEAALAGHDDETHLFETGVGAATSIVYAPVRLTRAVFDAVLNKRVAPDAEQWLAATSPGSEAPPPIRFLATLCPACGWQLEAARDSLVLLCVNCRAAWRANQTGLRQVPYSLLETNGSPGTGAGRHTLRLGACASPRAGQAGRPLRIATELPPRRYLPFWRVSARISGLRVESWADLVRFANLPKVVKKEWGDERAVFWIPAFKAQPDQFVRLSQTATLARPGHGTGEIRPAIVARVSANHGGQAGSRPGAAPPDDPAAPPLRTCYPVTLDEDALPAAVKVLLANLAHPKTRVFPLLRELSVAVTASDLVYIPLDFNGREYRHPGLQLTVQSNLLEWGARL